MDAIRSLLKSSLARGLHGLAGQDKLELAWIVVCGPALAARSTVTGYADGIVTVEVTDRPWLEEIRSIKENLAAELERVAGLRVSKLHLVVKR